MAPIRRGFVKRGPGASESQHNLLKVNVVAMAAWPEILSAWSFNLSRRIGIKIMEVLGVKCSRSSSHWYRSFHTSLALSHTN